MSLFDATNKYRPSMRRPAVRALQYLSPPPKKEYLLIHPRAPQAQDSGRPSIIALGTDILTVIVDCTYDIHPESVLSIALVTSYFHNLARYSQHRTVTFAVPNQGKPPQAIHNRLEYLEKQGLLPAVRELEVDKPANLSDDVLARLCTLMPHMTGLRDIKWPDFAIPPGLLAILRASSSNVRLHTQLGTPYGRVKKNTNLYTLPSNPNLCSLQVRVEYTNAPSCLAITQPLKQILLTCPNLLSLTLDLSLPRSGCVVYGPPTEYCGFGFTDEERPLAALEELVLVGYPFGRVPRGAGSQGETHFFGGLPNWIGYLGSGPEVDYWANAFDWSRLRRLETADADFALALMPKLGALKDVVLSKVWHEEQSVRFYQEVLAELESIAVPKMACIGVDGILRHRCTLRRLRVHQDEDYRGIWRQDAITTAQLREIRDACPLLEELGLDVARPNNDWPWDLLDVLATFPRLRRLAIWFEVGLDNREAPIQPYVTFSAAAMLYHHLCGHSPRRREQQASSRLKELEIHAGSPPPMGHGYPAPQAYWPSSQSMTFTCTLCPRDDEAAEGRFVVACPGLSARDDQVEDVVAEMKRRMKGGEDLGRGKMKLALEGPTPLGNWDRGDAY
ncbi:hypothetical protein LTR36_007181 [Oleoguttula mirabilis]|uniref:Uncharacterized protein n=1 Tax=Oleoguttula mirabilis TaxID=1507867 RepID=A0AAV9JAF6_9PEZI|nr:hypothetical protein LTR36_007181 [Oleoguttula mirabilis]